ncbi:MAG: exosortase U, partial [Pirellulaceae bacterium]
FPFFIYHDVGICYRSSGWEINRYEPIGREAGVPTGEEAEGVLHFEMRRSLGAEYGYVVFTLIDEFGATIPPPQPQAVGDAVWDHIRRGPLSLLIRSLKRDKRLDRPLIQLQYFAAKKSPFSEVEREAVVQQFFGALPAMRERIAGAFQEQARR